MLQSVTDGVADRLALEQNVGVPEAHNAETLRREIAIASNVIFTIGMLAAIGFDNQTALKVNKIGDVPIKHDLTFELVTGETLGAEQSPQSAFGICRVCPHPFRSGEQDL